MRKNLLLIIVCLSFYVIGNAQVGINILHPDSSAILHLESSNKGFLPPRLTTIQRDNIYHPAQGLIIFNTTDSFLQYYNGECWLNSYQRNCNECEFIMTLSSTSGTIDRTLVDTVTTNIEVRQTSGTAQTINLLTIAGLPAGMYATIDTSAVDSAGSVGLHVTASIFSTPGTYPIIIQGVCGSNIRLLVYNVVVEPCVRVAINSSSVNYNLQTANGLPGPGTPICVIVDVAPGVTISSANTTTPAYTSGNLDNRSHVGFINNGNILGKGGNGAYGGSFSGGIPGNPGNPGGNSMELTSKTTLLNNGYIFGGGSGGGSVGLSFSIPIPIIGGSYTIGAGLGGGGGSENGLGGTVPSGTGIFRNGTNATGGVLSNPGLGGTASAPIPISISIATLTITPSGGGGNGGAYGQTGARGYLDLSLSVSVSIPIVGTVTIPIPVPGGLVPAYGPISGPAGFAIKRNSHPLIGLVDGAYNTSFIKGAVAP